VSDVVDEAGFVELATAIEALRGQLLEAQAAGVGRPLSFVVGKVEVELSVEAKTTGGGGLGLRFGVFSADAKADRASGSAHKVKLELIPTGPDGKPFQVASGAAGPTPE
jgi:hypothetical protein